MYYSQYIKMACDYFISLPISRIFQTMYVHACQVSPFLGGRVLFFDLIALLNIDVHPGSGKLPLFWPHLQPTTYHFPSKEYKIGMNFPMKMHCLVTTVSKYKS